MATLIIADLEQNLELDRQAMKAIVGGRSAMRVGWTSRLGRFGALAGPTPLPSAEFDRGSADRSGMRLSTARR
jgi:hypothetical protein